MPTRRLDAREHPSVGPSLDAGRSHTQEAGSRASREKVGHPMTLVDLVDLVKSNRLLCLQIRLKRPIVDFMRVLVTGATGFVGHALVMRLLGEGHEVVAVSRAPAGARARLGAGPDIIATDAPVATWVATLERCDAVVHLAGEPLVGARWTAGQRQRLRHSRVELAKHLGQMIAKCKKPPRAFVSASAIGIYGDRGDEPLTEASRTGADFLAELCRDWEAATTSVEELGVRVARLRIGLVLGRNGGLMAKLEPVFRMGLGGRLASGRQYMSWIHVDDLVSILATALEDDRYRGSINATAPAPVDNRTFTKKLAEALGRPALLVVPATALAARFGAAHRAIIASQRVLPAALQALGFHFQYPTLESALADICALDASVKIGHLQGDAPPSPYLARRGARYQLYQRVVIDSPVTEVFSFFSQAENLGAITPPEMSFAIQTPTPIPMRKDQRIDYEIRLGPVPMRWRTRIEAWEPGHRFIDTQERGPYRSWWHEHRFQADGSRTIMEDRVLFSPPLGLLGRLAYRLFIRRMLVRIFTHRTDVIRRRFGNRREALSRAA